MALLYDIAALTKALKLARVEKDYFQSDIAKIANTEQQTVSRWERGLIPQDRWEDIKKAYGVDPADYLLRGSVSASVSKSHNVAQAIGGTSTISQQLDDGEMIIRCPTTMHRHVIELLLDADATTVREVYIILSDKLSE